MKRLQHNIIFGLGLVFLLFHSSFPGQIDTTADKRYTLSKAAIGTLEKENTPIRIDVFLNGQLPQNFQRLRKEAETLLQQMATKRNIIIEFINPFQDTDDVDSVVTEMLQYGLTPHNVVNSNTQSLEQTVIFPWAIVSDGSRSIRVDLLKKNLGDTPELQLYNSIKQLEYQFTDAIIKLQITEKKSIAVLTSHDTSSPASTADLLQTLKPYYNLAAFDLKALENDPQTTLDNLKRFDLLFISNPKQPFSQKEKFLIDQYQISGGTSIWAVNAIQINRDSLFNSKGRALAFPNALNLDDFFFKRGVRLESNLIKDMYCAPIVLAQGSGNSAQYLPYPWTYYPLINTINEHPIGAGVGNVWLQFASSIDTLKTKLNKKFILRSSSLSKAVPAPFFVDLEEATQTLNPAIYSEKNLGAAVLIEGQFESLFINRVLPVENLPFIESGATKMLVFSDGNIAENQMDKGQPLELGYDKWTNNFYNNKILLQNAFHYLLGEEERVALRSKNLEVAFLEANKIKEKRVLLPVVVAVVLLLFMTLIGGSVWAWRNYFVR